MLQLKSKGSGIFNIWMKIQDSVWYKGSSRRGGGAHDGAFLVTEALSPIRAFLHGLAQICKAQESSCFSWLVSGKNEWRNRKVLIQYRPARNDDEIIWRMNSESGTTEIYSQYRNETLNLNVKWKVITACLLGYAVVHTIAVWPPGHCFCFLPIGRTATRRRYHVSSGFFSV